MLSLNNELCEICNMKHLSDDGKWACQYRRYLRYDEEEILACDWFRYSDLEPSDLYGREWDKT